MIKSNRFLLSMIMGLAMVLAGCSGGGGGGNSDGGAGGLIYSGVTNEAAVDESNAAEIAGGAFETGLIGDGMMGLSLEQPTESYQIREFRSVKVPRILSDSLYLVDFTAASSGDIQAAAQAASDIIEGSCGGTMSYSITFDDQLGTFGGSFAFSNYCNDGITINGSTRFNGQMDVDSGSFIEATFSFDNLSGGELILDGEVHVDFEATPNVITFDAYSQDPVTGAVFWIEDYIITIDEYADHVVIEMAGRFYHPVFGHVTLSMPEPPEPLVLYNGEEWPESGALVVTGANGSKAKLTAVDHLTCTVAVDSDGDDTYEWESDIMNWEDL